MGRLHTQVEEENAHRCQLITEQSRLSVEMTIGIRWRSDEASRDPLKMRAGPIVHIRRTFLRVHGTHELRCYSPHSRYVVISPELLFGQPTVLKAQTPLQLLPFASDKPLVQQLPARQMSEFLRRLEIA